MPKISKDRKSQPVDPSKLSTINSLIDQLSQLMSALLTASRAETDPAKLVQISNEMTAVQSIIDQAAQAQAAANDILFDQATKILKTQATMLDDMEKKIKTIVSDVALAGRIIGYITQAITLVAKL